MTDNKADIAIYIYRIQEERTQSPLFLARAAAHYLSAAPIEGITATPAFLTEKGEKGKPYFPQYPGLHFSISHSGGFWACAMADQAVGLDLQIHTNGRKERIAKRFLHPQENEYLQKNNYRAFFDVWAAKESYVKYTGRGIGEDFGRFTASSQTSLAPSINGIQLRSIPFRQGYSLCLSAKKIQGISVYFEA